MDSEPPSFNISELKGKGENILFVDDVKEQRAIGKKVLTDFRYNPVCLESGEKAIEYCRTEKPDLLIVDMIMEPGMNGYETLKALRKIHPDLKAIVISGYSETDQVRSALDLGGAIFLKKPYAVEDFAAAIHKILG